MNKLIRWGVTLSTTSWPIVQPPPPPFNPTQPYCSTPSCSQELHKPQQTSPQGASYPEIPLESTKRNIRNDQDIIIPPTLSFSWWSEQTSQNYICMLQHNIKKSKFVCYHLFCNSLYSKKNSVVIYFDKYYKVEKSALTPSFITLKLEVENLRQFKKSNGD